MWNPVLEKFIEIKNAFVQEFGQEKLWESSGKTCVEYWVEKLGKEEYKTLIKPLHLNQHNKWILVRYGNYSAELAGMSYDDFWDYENGFYMECRGLVLDMDEEVVVLTPFRKFRNLNEGRGYYIDDIKQRIEAAETVEISDKLDGSMQSVRWYKEQVVIAGSKALDPEQSWRLKSGLDMLGDNHKNMLRDNPDYTFIFEHISMKDSHVVVYDKEAEGMYLIGIRDTRYGSEASYKQVLEMAHRYQIKTTQVFDKTLEQLMNTLDDKKSHEAEGFVLNIDGFKVKVKYNDYVGVHRLISKVASPNYIIQHIAEGTLDDVMSKLPYAYRKQVNKIAAAVYDYREKMLTAIEENYEAAPKTDRREFMIWVDQNFSGEMAGYLKSKYLGKEYDVIKSRMGHYKTLGEMGIFKGDKDE